MDERVVQQRARFSGLHELAHHLFEQADDGYLRARLKDIFHLSPEAAKRYEEELCDAAALLLMPTRVLQDAANAHAYGPLAVLALVEQCGASVQAATRRVIWHRSVPSFGVLLRLDGTVLDNVSHGHSKEYPIGRNFLLEADHPLRTAEFLPGRLEEFHAPVPFSNGNRRWTMRVRACDDGTGRVLAFFNQARHIIRADDRQPMLF